MGVGLERLHRLQSELLRPSEDVEAKLLALDVPGKQTEVERLLAEFGLAAPLQLQKTTVPGRRTRVDGSTTTRLDFEDYRILALRHLLHRLGPHHPLCPEVLAVADRTVARRAVPAVSLPPQASSPGGHAMWYAAERHAVTLYRHAADAGEVNEHDPAIVAALDQRGNGQSLPTEVSRDLEAEFGISLARVRVHTDSLAAHAAHAVGADAFTLGDDIFFADGAFAPETSAGRKLLAHELAHVLQARQGRAEASHGGLRTSRPGDSLEREAESMAEQVEHSVSRRDGARLTAADPLGAIALEAQLGRRMSRFLGSELTTSAQQVPRGNEGLPGGEQRVNQLGERLEQDVDAVAEPASRARTLPEEVLTRATAGTPTAIPFQTALEQFFGRSLPAIDAFTGRSELSELGACGATVGRTVVFAESSPSLPMVAHEVTHVLQQEHVGSPVRKRHEIADVAAPAEHEADAAARAIASGEAAVFPVRQRPAPIVHLSRDSHSAEPTGPIKTGSHWIKGTPFGDVVARTNVTYEAMMVRPNQDLGTHTYVWKCINDPATRGSAPAEVPGPQAYRWDAHWDFGGHHKIVCTVQFHPTGGLPRAPEELSYWQLVRSIEEMQQEQEDEALLRLVDPTAAKEPATSATRTPGSTKVAPDVAAKILENMAKGEPPFKPELGKGGCSWFVTEGRPFVGIDPAKNVDLPVEIDRTTSPVIFDEAKLDALFKEQRANINMPEIEAKYRLKKGLASDAPLGSKARKAIERVADGIAESKMWDQVAAEVKRSSSKVGEVILENSEFSKQGNGKFLVVADAKKIQVKGGMTAVVEALEAGGAKVEPVVAEAVEKTAARLKWAGRVRGAFRYGGRILIVVAIAADAYRIYHAQDKVKTIVETAGGWTGASMMAAGFAEVFAPADAAGPWAWAAHGVGTLVAGGIGYWIGSKTTRTIYEIIVEDP